MARINVEIVALLDPRFRKLARTANLVNRYEAIGRALELWGVCLEQNRYELTREEVQDVHPDVPNMYEAMIASDLAEEVSEGVAYICGTRGRIEWLERKRATARENGAKGGRPPKNPIETELETNTGFAIETNSETPPAPAPAPALVPALVPVLTLDPKAKTTPSESKKKSAKDLVESFEIDETIRAEARRLGLDADALLVDWRDYYRANGYKVGRNPLKNPSAAFSRWLRNAKPTGARAPIRGAQAVVTELEPYLKGASR